MSEQEQEQQPEQEQEQEQPAEQEQDTTGGVAKTQAQIDAANKQDVERTQKEAQEG